MLSGRNSQVFPKAYSFIKLKERSALTRLFLRVCSFLKRQGSEFLGLAKTFRVCLQYLLNPETLGMLQASKPVLKNQNKGASFSAHKSVVTGVHASDYIVVR